MSEVQLRPKGDSQPEGCQCPMPQVLGPDWSSVRSNRPARPQDYRALNHDERVLPRRFTLRAIAPKQRASFRATFKKRNCSGQPRMDANER